MSKWISADELIEFCDTERSMLNAHNGGNSVACAALRRVVDFVKEYAVEAEPNKDWISVNDRLPDDDGLVLVYTKDSVMSVCSLVIANAFASLKNLKVWEDNNGYYVSDVTHWMPLPQKPENEGDAE